MRVRFRSDLCLSSPGSLGKDKPETANLEEIAGLPLILPSTSSGLRSLVEEAANDHGIKINPLLEIDSVTATKELVTKGVGHAILPLGAVKREVDDGQIGRA